MQSASAVRGLNGWRLAGRLALASYFFVGGIAHFLRAPMFVAIVPPYLPDPLMLVYISGAFELLGAIGILVPRTRVAAGWGLVALMAAVLPANVQMALHADQYPRVPEILLWVRLPAQFLLAALAVFCCKLRHGRGPERGIS